MFQKLFPGRCPKLFFSRCFFFEKDPMLVFHTGFQPALAGRSARAFGARSSRLGGLKPHRMRASAIPIVCLSGNGGGDVSPETYRNSELDTMSKIFSSRCLNIFLAHLSFSKKDQMLFFIQILGRRRPVGQTPFQIFSTRAWRRSSHKRHKEPNSYSVCIRN